MTVCHECCMCNTQEGQIQPVFNWSVELSMKNQPDHIVGYVNHSEFDPCYCKDCWEKASQIQHDNYVDKYAKQAHQIWSHWMKHFMGRYCDVVRMEEDDSIAMIVPAKDILRWRRQMNTPYENLTEEEKESDRKVARKYLL